MLDLHSKTALVTGAGRGLGRRVAVGLAERGARVALVARNEDQLRATAQEIESVDGTAIVFPADIARPDSVDALMRHVTGALGKPDVLVNAAGVFGPIQTVADSDVHRWIETLEVNTVGPYLMCRACVGAMVARGWGRIINFSSAASLHTPGPLNSAYGTSKVALNQLTRHLAAEIAGTGVTANVIHPGEVKTEMWATIARESASTGAAGAGYRAWAADVGQSGGDDPQLALDLVLRLLSDEAREINGQFLWIEGGMQQPIPSW